MSTLGVFAYCAAMGFVAAATISTFYQWVTSERAELFAMRQGFFGLGLAVVISMFGGPFIVVQKVVTGLRAHEISAVPAALGIIVAGMWSVCVGIFYVHLLVSA